MSLRRFVLTRYSIGVEKQINSILRSHNTHIHDKVPSSLFKFGFRSSRRKFVQIGTASYQEIVIRRDPSANDSYILQRITRRNDYVRGAKAEALSKA